MTIAAAVKEEIKELLLDDSPEGRKKLHKALDEAGRELPIERPTEWGPFEAITLRDLMAKEFPPMTWIAKGMVPVGLTVLAGKPKIGKSWLGLQLALSVASGSRFLGFETLRGPVLMVCLEDSDRRISDRLRLQHAAGDESVEFLFDWPPLDGDGFDMLAQKVVEGGKSGAYGLCIIDTLASAKSGKVDENSAAAMSDLLYPLQGLAQEYQLAIVLVFHHRKGAFDDPIWDVRGSSATGAAVDCLIGVYREKGTKEFSLLTRSRDAPELDLKIEFSETTFSWHALGRLQELAKSRAEKDVLSVLSEFTEADVKSIARELGKAAQGVRLTVKRMERRGVLVARKETTRGRAKMVYRIDGEEEKEEEVF